MLEKDGWVHDRTVGDHRIFVKEGKRPIVVPGKLNDELAPGTQASILRAMKQ